MVSMSSNVPARASFSEIACSIKIQLRYYLDRVFFNRCNNKFLEMKLLDYQDQVLYNCGHRLCASRHRRTIHPIQMHKVSHPKGISYFMCFSNISLDMHHLQNIHRRKCLGS